MIKKALIVSTITIAIVLLFSYLNSKIEEYHREAALKRIHLWNFRSVDTVKYSRDLAREKMGDEEFNKIIDKQVSDIASLGASHIAISTPYDPEFLPFLKRWVLSAREKNLKVWFRGNFSGWEKWFDHERIGREEHKKLLEEFIKTNADLFEDGDIFTSCPECENGGPGDPRHNGDVVGHRKFLIDEYNISKESFAKIDKNVQPGFYSMNYDVATLIMDEDTTNKLGNLVVIDHYIKDPKKLAKDAKKIAEKSKGEVILGEFGAPIPDIHGSMTDGEQADWINQALQEVGLVKEVIGVNYWTNVGGSTALWNSEGDPKTAVVIIRNFYKETKLISPR